MKREKWKDNFLISGRKLTPLDGKEEAKKKKMEGSTKDPKER